MKSQLEYKLKTKQQPEQKKQHHVGLHLGWGLCPGWFDATSNPTLTQFALRGHSRCPKKEQMSKCSHNISSSGTVRCRSHSLLETKRLSPSVRSVSYNCSNNQTTIFLKEVEEQMSIVSLESPLVLSHKPKLNKILHPLQGNRSMVEISYQRTTVPHTNGNSQGFRPIKLTEKCIVQSSRSHHSTCQLPYHLQPTISGLNNRE